MQWRGASWRIRQGWGRVLGGRAAEAGRGRWSWAASCGGSCSRMATSTRRSMASSTWSLSSSCSRALAARGGAPSEAAREHALPSAAQHARPWVRRERTCAGAGGQGGWRRGQRGNKGIEQEALDDTHALQKQGQVQPLPALPLHSPPPRLLPPTTPPGAGSACRGRAHAVPQLAAPAPAAAELSADAAVRWQGAAHVLEGLRGRSRSNALHGSRGRCPRLGHPRQHVQGDALCFCRHTSARGPLCAGPRPGSGPPSVGLWRPPAPACAGHAAGQACGDSPPLGLPGPLGPCRRDQRLDAQEVLQQLHQGSGSMRRGSQAQEGSSLRGARGLLWSRAWSSSGASLRLLAPRLDSDRADTRATEATAPDLALHLLPGAPQQVPQQAPLHGRQR